MTLPTVDQIYLILIIATLVAMCLLVLIFNFKLYLADDDTVLIYTETNYTPKVDEPENEVYVVSVIQPVNDVKLKYKLINSKNQKLLSAYGLNCSKIGVPENIDHETVIDELLILLKSNCDTSISVELIKDEYSCKFTNY